MAWEGLFLLPASWLISPSKDPAYDVNYNFGQVSIDKPKIGYQGNVHPPSEQEESISERGTLVTK